MLGQSAQRIIPETAYAYLERKGDPLVLELLEFRKGNPQGS